MQKKIIALAIAAAFSAPAFADDNVKVSVYGMLDVGYGNEVKTVTASGAVAPNTNKYNQSALQLSTMTSSRLGFLATEDMANGTKATLKVETGISSNAMAGFSQTGANTAGTGTATTAVGANGTTLDATTLGNRELNLALAFATETTVKAGYGSTPIRDISLGYAADPGGNLVGNLLNNDATLGSNRAVSLDVIQQFGPVKATVSMSKDSLNKTDNAGVVSTVNAGGNTRGYLVGAEFKQDAVAASFAYQNQGTMSTAGATGVDASQKIAILGASYDLGVAKIMGEFANIKNDDKANALATGNGSRNYTSVGAQAPFGDVLAFAQVSMGKVNRVATGATASESRNASGMTLGAKYNMSKLTYAYATYGQTNLKAGAVDANATGVKVSQFALGLVHTF
jgi:predicted porin